MLTEDKLKMFFTLLTCRDFLPVSLWLEFYTSLTVQCPLLLSLYMPLYDVSGVF